MVTKREALDRFVRERVLGDRGFAVKPNGRCTYDHSVNGGCEIGQYLTDEDLKLVRDDMTADGVCTALPERFDGVDDRTYYASGKKSRKRRRSLDFWLALQRSHDWLARYALDIRGVVASDDDADDDDYDYLYRDRDSCWTEFQIALKKAADLC